MLAGARLRRVAGTRWGTRPYMDMSRITEQETEAALSVASAQSSQPAAPHRGQGRKQKTEHPPSTLDKRRLIYTQLDERYRTIVFIRDPGSGTVAGGRPAPS